jgi:hypothetical protein
MPTIEVQVRRFSLVLVQTIRGDRKKTRGDHWRSRHERSPQRGCCGKEHC